MDQPFPPLWRGRQDNVVVKIAFSHGGLDFLYFVADPNFTICPIQTPYPRLRLRGQQMPSPRPYTSLSGPLSYVDHSHRQDNVVGKIAFSHGGLDFLYFVADPAQPLDGFLRATWVR